MDTVVGWFSLHEDGWFTTVLISSRPQLADPCYHSALWFLLFICKDDCVFSNAGVDWNWKLNFIWFFDCFENLCQKWQDITNSEFVKSDNKWHIINIQIKYTIIVIVNYTISEMYLLLFNLAKSIILSKSFTHPLNFYGIITNNPPCIVYIHLIRLKITGRFLKWFFPALNRVNNNRAVFGVRSPIKIHSTPRPGLG